MLIMVGRILIIILIYISISVTASAGPPFRTDDPEPVEYRHWEAYVASQGSFDRDETSLRHPILNSTTVFFPMYNFI
jgi:hypothetical protein